MSILSAHANADGGKSQFGPARPNHDVIEGGGLTPPASQPPQGWRLITDSDNLEKTVSRDAGVVKDRRFRIVIAMLRQTFGNPGDKVRLIWRPTHLMVADALTKLGLSLAALCAFAGSRKYTPVPLRKKTATVSAAVMACLPRAAGQIDAVTTTCDARKFSGGTAETGRDGYMLPFVLSAIALALLIGIVVVAFVVRDCCRKRKPEMVTTGTQTAPVMVQAGSQTVSEAEVPMKSSRSLLTLSQPSCFKQVTAFEVERLLRAGGYPTSWKSERDGIRRALASLEAACCYRVPGDFEGSNQHWFRIKCVFCKRLYLQYLPRFKE